MGRRTLPRIDQSISIARYYHELAELDPPLDIERLFGRTGALEIEIGSGKGLFLLNASAAHPRRLFLGLEMSIKYARFAASRLASRDCDNVRIVRGDAIRCLDEFVPADRADAVHIYFPDPWWKERHRRRRVIRESTIANIQRVLVPGGTLHFWTDVEEYYETTCQLMTQFPAFSLPRPVPVRPAEHDMDYHTHFERRMRLNDHPVFRAEFRCAGAD